MFKPPVNHPPKPTGASACREQDEPLYAFGHGLSYTTFAYSGLAVSAHPKDAPPPAPENTPPAPPAAPENGAEPVPFGAGDELRVSVTITNTGARSGAWPVLLFVGDDAAVVPPAPPMLKAFRRVVLDSGASETLHFVVRPLSSTKGFDHKTPIRSPFDQRFNRYSQLCGAPSLPTTGVDQRRAAGGA